MKSLGRNTGIFRQKSGKERLAQKIEENREKRKNDQINSNLIIQDGHFSESELNAANRMALNGHKVILRSPQGTRQDGGTSDLVVDGINYDVYTPVTNNPAAIIRAITKKNTQARGIVLDLSLTTVNRDELGDVLRRGQNAITCNGGFCNIEDIIIITKEMERL